jgi:hypothetical protein
MNFFHEHVKFFLFALNRVGRAHAVFDQIRWSARDAAPGAGKLWKS